MSRFALLLVSAFTMNACPALAAEFTVGQKNSVFEPAELIIHRGDKVIFLNDDSRTHNVFSSSAGNVFDTKAQRPGTKTEITFDTPGTVEVYCAIHLKMKMIIHVQE
jgi:plastocyanin